MAASTSRMCKFLPQFYSNVLKHSTLLRKVQCKPVKSIWSSHHINKSFSVSSCNFKDTVTLHFVFPSGKKSTVEAKVGDSLLDIVVDKNIDIDGFGACEGTLACSTCHLVFSKEQYEKLPELPSDEELDMLDLAYLLKDTSRLGCQIAVSKDMENWEIQVPEGVADAREV